ncbi:hypothetical protein CcaCcLH18_07671 [Colletotrichum camelliae]|nr:hypothetical protein CcaCcLH18_07671 [Colletotrichum camelliae]
MNSPISLSSNPVRQEDAALNIRDKGDHGYVKPQVEVIHPKWGWVYNHLTNLVAFVQLLNHEQLFRTEAVSFTKKLRLLPDDFKLDRHSLEKAAYYRKRVQGLIERTRAGSYDSQHAGCVPMAEQILCESAHQALGEDFWVPKQCPISEESLVNLPVGMRLRHAIRTFRLDIQCCRPYDIGALIDLVDQLVSAKSTLEVQFGITLGNNSDTEGDFDTESDSDKSILLSATLSLVLSEAFTQPLVRSWVRQYINILQHFKDRISFPISDLAEMWNGNRDPAEFSSFARIINVDERDHEGHSLLHIAVLCGKSRLVRAIVEGDTDPYWAATLRGSNPFQYAAALGDVDSYRELLRWEKGKIVERAPGYNDDMPLHIAARNGHRRMVDYILSIHSDDKSYVNKRNASLETPLMEAAKSGTYDLVQFLLDYPGVDLEASDEQHKTALSHAHDNEDIICLILSKLPDGYFNMTAREGVATPLHYLARYAGQKAMHLVLSAPSVLPDEEGKNGETPLHHAVLFENLEAVKILGARQDVDVTKLSKILGNDEYSMLGHMKKHTSRGNACSQILDWLRTNRKELEADIGRPETFNWYRNRYGYRDRWH